MNNWKSQRNEFVWSCGNSICLVIVERFSLLCVLSVFTRVHTQKIHTNAVFHCCQHCLSKLFSQAFDSLTFLPPFFCFPLCPCFCLSAQSSICHLYSSFLFLFLSIPIPSLHFLSKELKVMGFKAQVKTEIQKQRKSSTVCNSTLITTLK